ncbi:hypothetical protein ACLOJK_007095 [Asimina triloba]
MRFFFTRFRDAGEIASCWGVLQVGPADSSSEGAVVGQSREALSALVGPESEVVESMMLVPYHSEEQLRRVKPPKKKRHLVANPKRFMSSAICKDDTLLEEALVVLLEFCWQEEEGLERREEAIRIGFEEDAPDLAEGLRALLEAARPREAVIPDTVLVMDVEGDALRSMSVPTWEAVLTSGHRAILRATLGETSSCQGAEEIFLQSFNMEARALKILDDLLPVQSMSIRWNDALGLTPCFDKEGRGPVERVLRDFLPDVW